MVKFLQDYLRVSFIKIALVIFFLLQLSVYAQSGKIVGVVTDASSGEPLYGANVLIVGTSIGAATDFYGEFNIPIVPYGTHVVAIRYLGYKEQTVVVDINDANQERDLEIALEAEMIEGETVTVTAQAQGQMAAINQQLTSDKIKNVVSADKIRQLPDDNAAKALSRLPGVSLMNGDQIVIRGVEAKLNQVMVNGIQLPSTSMSDRSTNLGFISSNMLSGLEVVKAITPDMDANVVGGVVNLKLREADEGLHFDVMAQGNYNAQARSAENYKFWASISNRFFNNKLGVFIQANADRSDVGSDQSSLSFGLLGSGNIDYGQAVYKTENATMTSQQNIYMNSGGSLMLDYKLPNGKIVLQNTYAYNNTDNRGHKTYMNFASDNLQYTIDRNKFGKELMINALQAENTFGNIKAELSLSHSYSTKFTRNKYGANSDITNEFQFVNETSLEHAPWGYDDDDKPIEYSTSLQDLTMETVYGIFDNINPNDIDSTTLGGWVTGLDESFKSHIYNTSLDFTIPVVFSKDVESTFKVGGKYSRSTRENDVDAFFSGAGDADTYSAVENYFPGKVLNQDNQGRNRLRFNDVWDSDYDRGEYFLSDEYDFKNGYQYAIDTDIMDPFFQKMMTGWEPKLKKSKSWENDFYGAEQFAAGYVMGTFELFSKLTAMLGLRYEFYNMQYHSLFTYVTHSVYGDAVSTKSGTLDAPYDSYNVDRNDEDFFPNLQLRYKFNDWADVRFAYTTGISRPDYLAILPKVYYTTGGTMDVGNSKLKPTSTTNFDLNFSFYSNKVGLFTIGGFYKKLEDVIRYSSIYYSNISMYDVSIPDPELLTSLGLDIPSASTKINSYLNNPNPGYVTGLEVSWQTNFWYLPEPLNSLVLDINYTHGWSEMDYRNIRNIPYTYRDPITHRPVTEYITTDTIRTARLLHQADDVVNVALGLDYKGFSGRISFNMQGNVVTYIGLRPEDDGYTGNIYQWDFTLKQELPIEGLSIAFNGVNIFHNARYTYQQFRRYTDAAITENLKSVTYSPTIYQLNLRYTF